MLEHHRASDHSLDGVIEMAKAIVSFNDHFPEFNGVKIPIRAKDAYFDVTAMNKALGKRFTDWRKTQFSKRLIARIQMRTGIPIDWEDCTSRTQTPLIDYVRGDGGRMWVHPYIAMSYAMSDPEFQADINIWVMDLLTLGTVNPHLKQWTKEDFFQGLEYNRDDITEMYGSKL